MSALYRSWPIPEAEENADDEAHVKVEERCKKCWQTPNGEAQPASTIAPDDETAESRSNGYASTPWFEWLSFLEAVERCMPKFWSDALQRCAVAEICGSAALSLIGSVQDDLIRLSPNHFIVASSSEDAPSMRIFFPFSGARLVMPVALSSESSVRLASPLIGSRLVMPVAPSSES